ncbi:GntR family transcriptional regulator [Alteromonas gilva]|uniref:UTRA domain-containing protein n=1 Tax=Alteromonas gilva TaxID=2987522 RepID=A0ABT5KYM5_9ALTE|nr:UTRA domain-containing protein [Alteromonas gilva]MDC8829361.1 UTRA domain-containing protein [Alteromonas gilva]
MESSTITKTYLAIRDLLAERIDKDIYCENQKLPSERVLAEELKTTRLTLRDALSQLETEGRVFRMDRRGWFVAGRRLVFNPVLDKGFMTNVSDQGMVPKTELILLNECQASRRIADALRVPAGAGLYHMRRRRSINDRPVLIEDIYLEKSRYPGLQHVNLNGSLSLVLRDVYDVRVAYSDIAITPAAFDSHQAKLLNVSPGAPSIMINRTSYDEQKRIVEFDQEYWVSDMLQFKMKTQPESATITRDGAGC